MCLWFGASYARRILRVHRLDLVARNYDGVIYPEFRIRNYKARIIERNRYMTDASAYALCYAVNPWGGAAKTLEYAVKTGLEIINIYGP